MKYRIIILGMTVLAVAACADTPKKRKLCPQVAIVRALEKVDDYGHEEMEEKNLVATALMDSVEGECKYNDGRDEDVMYDWGLFQFGGYSYEESVKGQKKEGEAQPPGVDVNFSLKMLAKKGPRLGGDQFSVPYFVSVLDPENKILEKNLMTVSFKFSSSNGIAEQSDPLHVFIPMPKEAKSTEYRVIVGFQLTEEQIKASREKEDADMKKRISGAR
ncbi:MAG: hypothetical protein PHX43_03700 [Alphaproteobacteria bacterium]|nr:hypothetical protein [Alphaproteobacteria bacterium]